VRRTEPRPRWSRKAPPFGVTLRRFGRPVDGRDAKNSNDTRHMIDALATVVTVVYFTAAAALLLYGANCYVAIFLFARRRRAASRERESLRERFGDPMARGGDLPLVTTQLPVFNELNVAARVMEAACAMRYPEGRHEVQVLDDSTDETRQLVDETAERLRAEGHDITVIRRKSREGFKAGALATGMEQARGGLVAVFDADFVPTPDFLLKTVPFFVEDPGLGLAQARWGHLNRRHSLMTRAQSIGIDGHFMVEQSARTWNGLFMNFNGTAGVWRVDAIEAGGGWQWDTLTEDMDLSYRMQLAGWRTTYLPDLVVPAEIPEDVTAFKSQQFRWAKGSIQTAKKLLPRILRAEAPVFKKVQAFFHLTHYMVHPLMLTLALLALPVLTTLRIAPSPTTYVALGVLLALAMAAPSSLYVVSQRAAHADWMRRLVILPALVAIGVGVAVSNTRAVVEALVGRQSGFVRTPKRGDREVKRYKVGIPWLAAVEISVGLYCVASLTVYLQAAKYLVGPFLAIYAAGFLFVGLLTVAHALGVSDRPIGASVASAEEGESASDGALAEPPDIAVSPSSS